jgi:hypothetical protein
VFETSASTDSAIRASALLLAVPLGDCGLMCMGFAIGGQGRHIRGEKDSAWK